MKKKSIGVGAYNVIKLHAVLMKKKEIFFISFIWKTNEIAIKFLNMTT